jgi:hypothetical protein
MAMSKLKPLSAKQLAVIDDLFEGELKESEILKNHNLSKKLYDRWLADESFNDQLDRRIVWEYRRCDFMLARSVRQALSNLMDMTKSGQAETARKACIDIITMRANLLAGTRLPGTPALPGDSRTSVESPSFSPETAGKLLTILAEEKTTSAS